MMSHAYSHRSARIFPEMLQHPKGQEGTITASHHQPAHLSDPGRCLEMTWQLSLLWDPVFLKPKSVLTRCSALALLIQVGGRQHLTLTGASLFSSDPTWHKPHWCLWKEQQPLYLARQLHRQGSISSLLRVKISVYDAADKVNGRRRFVFCARKHSPNNSI